MVSVTQRIGKIKQPYGGFLKVKDFSKEIYNDDFILSEDESLHPSIVGMVTEYLAEIALGFDKNKVFNISIAGAKKLGELDEAFYLLENIGGLDDESIFSACKLNGYDVAFRAGLHMYKPVEDFIIDQKTIGNIRVMSERIVNFFEENGPIIDSGMTFEGGYTESINTGDGDILTENGLWDIKVSKNSINNKHTLQVFIYYLMGMRSKHIFKFKKVEKIGLFNPRLNTAYYMKVKDIPNEILATVERDVIGY